MRYKRIATETEALARIINALYADFDRRERQLRSEGKKLGRIYELNKALRCAVDSTCEEHIRKAMLFDLCNDIGYDRSSLACIMSHKAYYSRKKEVKLDAARRLGLI